MHSQGTAVQSHVYIEVVFYLFILLFFRLFTQRCTNPNCHIAGATEVCTVAPILYGCSVWNLLHENLPRFQNFGKFLRPLYLVFFHFCFIFRNLVLFLAKNTLQTVFDTQAVCLFDNNLSKLCFMLEILSCTAAVFSFCYLVFSFVCGNRRKVGMDGKQ